VHHRRIRRDPAAQVRAPTVRFPFSKNRLQTLWASRPLVFWSPDWPHFFGIDINR
jgi:hypothetical protein